MLNLKNKILSYKQYYKISVAYSLISSIIWAVWGVVDLLVMNDNKSLAVNIIFYATVFLSLTITMHIYMIASAMRDKEDELYKENVAKTNSSFLWFLFFAGFVLFIVVSVIKSFTNTITIPLHECFIGAVIYALYAVYHGIALRYERVSAVETEEE